MKYFILCAFFITVVTSSLYAMEMQYSPQNLQRKRSLENSGYDTKALLPASKKQRVTVLEISPIVPIVGNEDAPKNQEIDMSRFDINTFIENMSIEYCGESFEDIKSAPTSASSYTPQQSQVSSQEQPQQISFTQHILDIVETNLHDPLDGLVLFFKKLFKECEISAAFKWQFGKFGEINQRIFQGKETLDEFLTYWDKRKGKLTIQQKQESHPSLFNAIEHYKTINTTLSDDQKIQLITRQKLIILAYLINYNNQKQDQDLGQCIKNLIPPFSILCRKKPDTMRRWEVWLEQLTKF